MLSTVSYIGLGVLDSLAIILLMFKLYQWPVKEYWLEFLLFALWNAIISYLNRMVFEIPALDTGMQVVFAILLMRYVIKVRTIYSLLITGVGCLTYILIQMLVLFVFVQSGIATESDAEETFGIATVMQMTSIGTAYIISFLLYRSKLGFNYIIRPPHNVRSRETRISNKAFWIPAVAAAFVVSISGYLLFHVSALLLIALCVVSFAILYYLSKRRERQEYDRKFSILFSKKD